MNVFHSISSMTLPKSVSRLVLMSLGVVVLSSCAQANQANGVKTPSAEGNDSAALQERSAANVTPQAAAELVVTSQKRFAANPTVTPQDAAELAVTSQEHSAANVTPQDPAQPAVVSQLVEAEAELPAGSTALEVGLPYLEARTRLIQQGWVPTVAPEPGPYGVERQFYDMGMTEVSACSGTGNGACRFEFSHPDRTSAGAGNLLLVTTYGGANAELAEWELTTELARASSSTDVATDAVTDVAIAQSSEVPDVFQGLWNADPDQCAVPYSDGKLLVEPNRLTFYESSGPVVDVSVNGPSEVMVTTEISGEGMTSLETYTLQLSEDGSSLTVNGFVRVRCALFLPFMN